MCSTLLDDRINKERTHHRTFVVHLLCALHKLQGAGDKGEKKHGPRPQTAHGQVVGPGINANHNTQHDTAVNR